jgi:hypothetical protein
MKCSICGKETKPNILKICDLCYTNPQRRELSKIRQLSQRQDSQQEQLRDLYYIANKFGLYDAADYIREAAGIRK